MVWAWNVAEDDSLGIQCRCATSSCRRGRTAVRSVTAAERVTDSSLPPTHRGSQVRGGCGTIFRIAGRFWDVSRSRVLRGRGEHHWRVAHVLVSGGVMPPCVADGTVLCRIATPAAEAQDAPAWLWRGCVAARHLNGCGVRVPDAGHSLGTCLQLLSLTPEPSRPSLPTPCSPARDQAG